LIGTPTIARIDVRVGDPPCVRIHCVLPLMISVFMTDERNRFDRAAA